MKSAAFAVPVLALLAACGSAENTTERSAATTVAPAKTDDVRTAKGEAPGTTFALNADAKTGATEIALPGARLAVDLPGEMLTHSDMELNGTKLYPGSKVSNLSVKTTDTGTGDEDTATVDIRFTAPAAPDAVKAWFVARAGSKHPLAEKDGALVGRTEEGKPFRITLEPAPGGETAGRLFVDG